MIKIDILTTHLQGEAAAVVKGPGDGADHKSTTASIPKKAIRRAHIPTTNFTPAMAPFIIDSIAPESRSY